MDYIKLIKSIKQRPKFFLKSTSIEELDAFLRGVSYANYFSGEEDLFMIFRNKWIPSKFETNAGDWVEIVKNNIPNTDIFECFFDLWNDFLIEFNSGNI
jgi:hypothetical protein